MIGISDHESGQEGDFDDDLHSNGTFGVSARAQYHQLTQSQMSQISKGAGFGGNHLGRDRAVISAMSQNE